MFRMSNVLGVVLLMGLVGIANAATITFVGSETSGGGQRFRDTGVTKAYNTVAGEYYASDGYIFWKTSGGFGVFDLGPAGSSIKTDAQGKVSLPSYITDIVTARADIKGFQNTGNNRFINDPAAAPAAGLALATQTGGVLVNVGGDFGTTFDFITLTLGTIPPGGFRLGIMSDEYKSGANPAEQWLDAIEVRGTGVAAVGATGLSGAAIQDGNPDLHFFDISGFSSGNTLTIGASCGGTVGYPIISGLTFDTVTAQGDIPEPASALLLALALPPIAARLRRRVGARG